MKQIVCKCGLLLYKGEQPPTFKAIGCPRCKRSFRVALEENPKPSLDKKRIVG